MWTNYIGGNHPPPFNQWSQVYNSPVILSQSAVWYFEQKWKQIQKSVTSSSKQHIHSHQQSLGQSHKCCRHLLSQGGRLTRLRRQKKILPLWASAPSNSTWVNRSIFNSLKLWSSYFHPSFQASYVCIHVDGFRPALYIYRLYREWEEGLVIWSIHCL